MKENASNTPKRGKGGRSPKNDPANYRYSVNFTAVEHAQFLTLFERAIGAAIEGSFYRCPRLWR